MWKAADVSPIQHSIHLSLIHISSALGVLWGFRGEAELTAAGADALAAKPEDILAYLRCEKH